MKPTYVRRRVSGRRSRTVIRHKSQHGSTLRRHHPPVPRGERGEERGCLPPRRPAGSFLRRLNPLGGVRPRRNSPINRFCILATRSPPPSLGLLRVMIDTVKYGMCPSTPPSSRAMTGVRRCWQRRPIRGSPLPPPPLPPFPLPPSPLHSIARQPPTHSGGGHEERTDFYGM